MKPGTHAGDVRARATPPPRSTARAAVATIEDYRARVLARPCVKIGERGSVIAPRAEEKCQLITEVRAREGGDDRRRI